jgi:hypothetical protein
MLTRFTSSLALLALVAAPAAAESTNAAVDASELDEHIRHLSSDAMEGRGTGSRGERMAGDYLAKELARYGLEGGAADGGFFQSFQVAGRSRLAEGAALKLKVGAWYREFELKTDWNPFGFTGDFEGSVPLVFAGYGVTDPERGYDDYAGLDVRGKAVLVLRHEPREKEGIGLHSRFDQKAKNAKAHGAVAMLVVTDPVNHAGDDSLMPFGGGGDAGIAAAHVRQSLVEGLFRLAGKDLAEVQAKIDADRRPHSFAFDASLDLSLKVSREEVTARNVVAKLPGTDPTLKDEVLVIGAHYDHLGFGHHGGSLARGAGGEIHNGADDNASGTSGVLELAQAFAARPARRTIYFVGFSGEERGLLGSAHFVANPPLPREHIAAMINLDMIGRLGDDPLEVGGAGTAPGFKALIRQAAGEEGVDVVLEDSGFGPSDHASFYRAKIPVLFFFTGLHGEYHRPTDDAHLVDSSGAAKVTRVALSCARGIADADARPAYVQVARGRRGGNRARLGVMIDRNHPGPGVALAEVVDGSAAAKAGLQAGDVLLRLDGVELKGMRELIQALGKKKPGDEVELGIRRAGAGQTLKVKLGGKSSPRSLGGHFTPRIWSATCTTWSSTTACGSSPLTKGARSASAVMAKRAIRWLSVRSLSFQSGSGSSPSRTQATCARSSSCSVHSPRTLSGRWPCSIT